MLHPIDLPRNIDEQPIPDSVAEKLTRMRHRIEAFQDCWTQHHAAQFVAADYELVYQTLCWMDEVSLPVGRQFLEWGCGFATVACLAKEIGWAAFGIEAHSDLILQARRTVEEWPAEIELFGGNFLPSGADELAFDPTLPSLGHSGACPYEHWEMPLEDFSIVYSYPWPGEDGFHEEVFDRYGGEGSLLLMFIGPNEMRLWRHV